MIGLFRNCCCFFCMFVSVVLFIMRGVSRKVVFPWDFLLGGGVFARLFVLCFLFDFCVALFFLFPGYERGVPKVFFCCLYVLADLY